jgi:hypothetical protein
MQKQEQEQKRICRLNVEWWRFHGTPAALFATDVNDSQKQTVPLVCTYQRANHANHCSYLSNDSAAEQH